MSSTGGGYSGVVTFVRIHAFDGTMPLVEAEEGITGIINDKLSPRFKVGDSDWDESLLDDYTMEDLRELDTEGRTIVTDHGYFVLINVRRLFGSCQASGAFELYTSVLVLDILPKCPFRGTSQFQTEIL